MRTKTDREYNQRLEDVKNLASSMMHMHYCDHDMEGITALFSPQFSWLGTGEDECLSGREACTKQFLNYGGVIPKCMIWDEEYDVIVPVEDVYVVMGRMWIATDPNTEMYLKAHQRVTFVFRDTDEGLRCSHIHCSNPYQELLEGELFPDKIGRQSYEYVQERLLALEEEKKQQNRQMEVIMSSIAGGLKISNDDDTYSFAFVSREAAGLFGYTVEEFMEATGGTAVGTVYPPDLEQALADCAEAFKDGGLEYSTKYRVRCKDGSLKWIIDSGKKAQDADGNWMVNSLYLDITGSEEDAQRLREQTELLTSIYDTVPCGIIRFVQCRDGSYRLISLNWAVVLLMGYHSIEEGMGDWQEGVLGAVSAEDREVLHEIYYGLNKIGDYKGNEYRVIWKDGSVHWMQGTTMIVGTTSEGENILQRTVIDITQRKILQEQLNREQEMYRVAMEVSSAVMFEYDMEADRFISYEPITGEGVLRNEIENYSKALLEQEIVHPDDVPMVMDNICKGRTEVFEVRCSTPRTGLGSYLWYRANGRLVMDNGKPARVVGALYNIHRMKSELSENSERLYMNQSALQAINGVYVSIFYVNLEEDTYYAVRLPEAGSVMAPPRNGSYSGQLRSYILREINLADWNKVSDICRKENLLRELKTENRHMEVEFRNRQSELWLRMEVHLRKAENEKPDTAIIAFRNISAEKQKELEYYEEEKRAKHALEEAYDSLNKANQAKSDFLSKMSHDIRTPMNAILGMTTIAKNHMEDKEKMEDCLNKIDLSGGHLLELINKVLDMSKIEAGSVALSEDKFRIDGVLEEVSEIIRPDADSHKLAYTACVKQPKHCWVYGDAVRVKQILLNLLSNAVKYTNENGHINVRLEEKLSGRNGIGCYEFVVEDDGIGMSEPFKSKMFLPFERAEDSRVSRIQGTGLGLAITRNLVQMMNGNIQVESELNKGSRFTVTIFLKLAQEEEGAVYPHFSVQPGPEAGFAGHMRILLVEDNALNREIAEELLTAYGLDVICASNGQEAVDLFCAGMPGEFALILMDIQMPVLDGYGAARAIRKLAENGQRPDAEKIPIIALTANAFADDAYRAKQAGMNEHVAKPLEIGRLLEVMHRWI